VEAFARENAGFVTVGDTLVLAEHVAYFAAANADVTGRNIRVLADMAIEFRHEALAETHDFVVGSSLRIEVGAPLSAADGHAGQGVFEYLLEAEELDDAKVNRRVEAEPPFVGTQGAVEFNAKTAVYLDLPLVVLPGYPEDDLPLGLADPLDNLALSVLGVLYEDGAEGFENFPDRLVKLNFAWVTFENFLVNGFHFVVEKLR
jgi:hypothetical protein